MTTIHDFFSPTPLQTIVSASDPGGGYFETATWGDTIQWWLDNYPDKASFIAAATGNVPVFPWWYYFSSAPDSQYGLLKLGDSLAIPQFNYGVPPCNPGVIPEGVNFSGTNEYCGVNIYYSYEFSSNKGAGIANMQWAQQCTPGQYIQGWWQNGADILPSHPVITGDENQKIGFSPYFQIFFGAPMDPSIIKWTIPLSEIIQLESCKDINALADYLYGGPTPVITLPAFGMQYPPTNPTSTDILIPNHVSPAQKTPIHFQNYTQPLPRFIKK